MYHNMIYSCGTPTNSALYWTDGNNEDRKSVNYPVYLRCGTITDTGVVWGDLIQSSSLFCSYPILTIFKDNIFVFGANNSGNALQYNFTYDSISALNIAITTTEYNAYLNMTAIIKYQSFSVDSENTIIPKASGDALTL